MQFIMAIKELRNVPKMPEMFLLRSVAKAKRIVYLSGYIPQMNSNKESMHAMMKFLV